MSAPRVLVGGRASRRQLFAALLLLAAYVVASSEQRVASHPLFATQSGGRYYPQTGHTLAAQFVGYYDRHGGLPLFGYPITEAREEGGYLAQWTERERLEWHPENAGTGYEVLLGLLGNERTHGLHGPNFRGTPAVSVSRTGGSPGGTPAARYFAETRHSVSEPFLSYWSRHGGLAVFGYPISDQLTNDQGLQVQWFERARFEYHPEMPPAFRVSLGLLGVETLKRAGLERYELEVVNSPAPDPTLQLGFAQGGESEDPSFLDNVRDAGKALGPALVRLDNIFNFYHIVSRDAEGKLHYAWNDLDRVVDSVVAMGKQPFICLSYMPETLSASGNSRVLPPADYDEWAALVKATVQHLNGERKLGIKYWEVWNEPNQWGFWQSSFEEYLKLYDITAQAVRTEDPNAYVGGPAFSTFEPYGMSQFMAHEAAQGDLGKVDFLSWHAYGQSQEDMAAQIRAARAIAAKYPQFHPELFITEFNVQTGGPGDTSANGYTDTVEGAISLLSTIEAMQRERLDRAFLFELKDGPGPTQFWGRWGVLTNDAQPKPIYHALKAYLDHSKGMLPVTLKSGPADGSLGLMAFGGPQSSSLMLWYTGARTASVRLIMPPDFDEVEYSITLFDKTHNNPASSGDATLKPWLHRNAADLVLEIKPFSLALLTSTPH